MLAMEDDQLAIGVSAIEGSSLALQGMTEAIVERWRQGYNNERPQSSVGYQMPNEFAATWRLLSGTME